MESTRPESVGQAAPTVTVLDSSRRSGPMNMREHSPYWVGINLAVGASFTVWEPCANLVAAITSAADALRAATAAFGTCSVEVVPMLGADDTKKLYAVLDALQTEMLARMPVGGRA